MAQHFTATLNTEIAPLGCEVYPCTSTVAVGCAKTGWGEEHGSLEKKIQPETHASVTPLTPNPNLQPSIHPYH